MRRVKKMKKSSELKGKPLKKSFSNKYFVHILLTPITCYCILFFVNSFLGGITGYCFELLRRLLLVMQFILASVCFYYIMFIPLKVNGKIVKTEWTFEKTGKKYFNMVLVAITMFIFLFISLYISIPYIQDIKSVFGKSFITIEGLVQKVKQSRHIIGADIYVDNKKFTYTNYYEKRVEVGDEVIIEYLPNSKYIISATKR